MPGESFLIPVGIGGVSLGGLAKLIAAFRTAVAISLSDWLLAVSTIDYDPTAG